MLALSLLAWRVISLPITALIQDWISIIAFYALLHAVAARSKHWTFVTVVTATALLCIYVYGQFPYTLLIFRGGP